MNFLTDFFARFDVWLIVFGGVLLLRQLFTALAADHGRKQDLVKRLYKSSQDFQLSVLIPCLKADHLPEMLELLSAIREQEYPSSKVAVHIVTNEQTHHELEGLQMQEVIAPNVRLWHAPEEYPGNEAAQAWLIDRCLAVGGAGMFIFLKPTDMIKPDFFQSVVARGFDSFVIQGYVANKTFPESPTEKVAALSKRLANRIGNAGRYHLGLSCRLMDSGWAIKQDVLELVPFHRGEDVDNLEYTLRLNLEGFRVSWAPSMVVYSRDEQDFSERVTHAIGTFVNRLRMFLAYAPRLLTRAVTRFDLTYAESALSILKPPTVLIGAALVLLGIISAVMPEAYWPVGRPVVWFALALSLGVVQFCGLAVARGKGNDYATLALLTPFVYLTGLTMLPVGAVQYWSSRVAQKQLENERRQGIYTRNRATRFDETQAPLRNMSEPVFAYEDPYTPSRTMIDELMQEKTARQTVKPPTSPVSSSSALDAVYGKDKSKQDFWSGLKGGLPKASLPFAAKPPSSAQISGMDPDITDSSLLPMEQIKSVTLSNGQKQLDCLLKTLTTYDVAGEEYYRLTLEYKSLSFCTSTYKILDQAFYELYAKLSGKGLMIITCGSCGYFYNPTADVPDTLRNSGVCLFGKAGKEVNMSMDAVTVLSQPCDYHVSLEQRETLVQQWKDSLGKSQAASNR